MVKVFKIRQYTVIDNSNLNIHIVLIKSIRTNHAKVSLVVILNKKNKKVCLKVYIYF